MPDKTTNRGRVVYSSGREAGRGGEWERGGGGLRGHGRPMPWCSRGARACLDGCERVWGGLGVMVGKVTGIVTGAYRGVGGGLSQREPGGGVAWHSHLTPRAGGGSGADGSGWQAAGSSYVPFASSATGCGLSLL